MTAPPPPPSDAPAAAASVAPTPVSSRVLAPDLARGMMLLLIALAHAPWFLYASPVGLSPMHPVDGNLADRLAQSFTIIVVDGRTHTMFGLLFAYGIGQLSARQSARGTPERTVRGILRRRHGWMLIFGLVHAVLLWQGDILGTYGLIGLIMVPLFFRRSDRTLVVWIVVLLVIGGAVTALSMVGAAVLPAGEGGALAAAMQRTSLAETDYLLAAQVRVAQWLFGLLSGVGTLALPTVFLIGILAARHRILEQPERHLPLLRWVAAVGISLGWSVGLAQALGHVGVLGSANLAVLGPLHFFTGIFAGVGYAALFGLIGHRLSARGATGSSPVRGLAALGRRSLSGYLTQSLVYGPLLAAWGLGLGARLSSWSAMLLAVIVWLVTVGAALALERRGRRGPAEVLLRRLAYRRSRQSSRQVSVG